MAVPMLSAQQKKQNQPPRVQSPEVSKDRKLVFRVLAPKASQVRLVSSDIPDLGQQGTDLKKDDQGIWSGTVGPVPAGSYRYAFNIDGVTATDPRNIETSESNAMLWSVVHVKGSDYFDQKETPKGALSQIWYPSKTLKKNRRMHVYTPPGYLQSSEKLPVFYLLHGASDSDHSWTSVGRAHVILDNLIASGKAKPMIVVMPNGHTGTFTFGGSTRPSFEEQMQQFAREFATDIRPYVETNFRTLSGRTHRAIAGLSMGGAQTLDIAFENLADFGYVGVYSSGIFGIAGGFGGAAPNTQWEERRKSILDDASKKNGLKYFWFATGKRDFLLQTTKATVDMFKKHQFPVEYKETSGGHTWLEWRDYLVDFAPKLFRD
jgi:enterochelin esterase family protein